MSFQYRAHQVPTCITRLVQNCECAPAQSWNTTQQNSNESIEKRKGWNERHHLPTLKFIQIQRVKSRGRPRYALYLQLWQRTHKRVTVPYP